MSAEIIVALDMPNADEVQRMVDRLPEGIGWYKIGLELFCAEGPAALRPVVERGKSIFLDLKLHDIPRTVARAVTTASGAGARLLTVHACGGSDMLKAAVEAAAACGEDRPRLLAVTVLTSMDGDDLRAVGVDRTPSDQALALAELAVEQGIDGLVCSVHEAAALRERLGPDVLLVTPGIRLPEGDAGDQKRIATPEQAVAVGADFLVVGRPIVRAPDPRAAADEFLKRSGR